MTPCAVAKPFMAASNGAVRTLVCIGALFLSAQTAPAAEPIAVVFLYERSGPEVLPADGRPARSLLSEMAASLVSNAGDDGLASSSGGAIAVLDPDFFTAEALRDPAAEDGKIIAVLRQENASRSEKVDVLVRPSLQAFVAPREGGKPEEFDLHLRVDVSMRDVASGRPLGPPPTRKLLAMKDCGVPPDMACVQDFVAEAAGSLGREVGMKLSRQLAALLRPAAADVPATGNER
ncbi:hypothetical protein [Jiella pacifica]|uniref:Uncharacterized protein n=1 Tax=Jiella pacifica TaxID=2696469 RepID=A0A6N9T1S0_9HYPH|nr:hypothetical protein [Jiella pacifica]NDW03986.1 hypothetical protein [Jiella pacifica]